MLSDAHRQDPASGSHIDDFQQSGMLLGQIQQRDHQKLRFRSRNQNVASDFERQGIEFFLADKIGHRHPGRALLDQVAECIPHVLFSKFIK